MHSMYLQRNCIGHNVVKVILRLQFIEIRFGTGVRMFVSVLAVIHVVRHLVGYLNANTQYFKIFRNF